MSNMFLLLLLLLLFCFLFCRNRGKICQVISSDFGNNGEGTINAAKIVRQGMQDWFYGGDPSTICETLVESMCKYPCVSGKYLDMNKSSLQIPLPSFNNNHSSVSTNEIPTGEESSSLCSLSNINKLYSLTMFFSYQEVCYRCFCFCDILVAQILNLLSIFVCYFRYPFLFRELLISSLFSNPPFEPP